MSPKSALPPHMQGGVEEVWAGTDNSSWLMRMKKRLQYLVAAGPRVPSGFWKWREIPVTIFALKGYGSYRFENTDGSVTCGGHELRKWARTNPPQRVYLSRIQPWCQWHIALQWPLFFNCHIIYCNKNVVAFPTYKSAFGITKMFTFGVGFKRDGDKVYWLTANIGGNFE